MSVYLAISFACADAIETLTSGCRDEQQAAQVLGFNQNSWNDKKSKQAQPASMDKTWAKLTSEEKAAVVVLGYTGETWDNREPFANHKFWGDLTREQLRAVKALGHTPATWNNKDKTAVQPAYADKAWPQMTNDERAALEVLGYTATTWDEGTSPLPPSAFKTWEGLNVCGEDPSVTPVPP